MTSAEVVINCPDLIGHCTWQFCWCPLCSRESLPKPSFPLLLGRGTTQGIRFVTSSSRTKNPRELDLINQEKNSGPADGNSAIVGLFGMVSLRDPFKGWTGDLQQRSGPGDQKVTATESPGDLLLQNKFLPIRSMGLIYLPT